MGLLSKLFGGGTAKPEGESYMAEEEYKGFRIRAVEMKVGGEFQLCGLIDKEIAGEMKSHKFIRADRTASKTDVATLALTKGRQIIDEQGESALS